MQLYSMYDEFIVYKKKLKIMQTKIALYKWYLVTEKKFKNKNN